MVKKDLIFSRRRGAAFGGVYTIGNRRDLAVILPGLNYGCEKPLLAGVADLLGRQNMDLVRLNFSYADDAEFANMPDDEKLAEIARDGGAIVAQCLSLSQYRSLIVVGKSLGTVSMMGLGSLALPELTRFIWLTPSLRDTGLLAAMAEIQRPGFSLIGGRDPSVEISRSPEYRAIKDLTHLEVAGMDHGWEHESSDEQTRSGLKTALAAVENWL